MPPENQCPDTATARGAETGASLGVQLAGYEAGFNAWEDASPAARELAPALHAHLCARAAGLPSDFALVLRLPADSAQAEKEADCRASIRHHFRQCVTHERRELAANLGRAAAFALIGALFMIASAKTLARFEGRPTLISDGLGIGGWVFIWEMIRILSFQLYEHWTALRLYARLQTCSIHFKYGCAAEPPTAA